MLPFSKSLAADLVQHHKIMKKKVFLLFLIVFYLIFPKKIFGYDIKSMSPEIVYPKSSNVCNEFEIGAQESSSTLISPYPRPTTGASSSKNNTEGTLLLNEETFPDFEQMAKDMERAIFWLTPREILQHIEISGSPLVTKAKHFVLGTTENPGELIDPSEINIPETEITQPFWFTDLLGKSRWVCGIFGTCPAASSPVIKVEQAQVNISSKAYKNLCSKTGSQIPEKDTTEKPLQTNFTVLSLWEKITNFVEEVTEFFVSLFRLNKEEKTTLKVRTQGELAGGANFAAFSDFQRSFLPQSFMDEFEIKTGALATQKNNYSIQFTGNHSYSGNYQEPINFSDKVKEQLKRCMTLCSIYPAEFNIQTIDPLCPSCNINDYQLQYIEVDKTNCHLQPGGGCDYKDDTASVSCDGDPVCESGKCYPNQYRMIGDYTSNGCTPPYPGNGCTIPEICQKMTFKPNSAGGFGPCQYENPNVCVRTDWIQGGMGRCDYLCNWACCAYQ